MKKWIQHLIFLRIDQPLKLTVKLYGTLSRSFEEYTHLSGLEVILPEESSIHDLLVYLKLSPERLGMISMDGRLLNKKSQLKNGALIKIFQPIAGG
jgi:sulfur carrier protein ThiS